MAPPAAESSEISQPAASTALVVAMVPMVDWAAAAPHGEAALLPLIGGTVRLLPSRFCYAESSIRRKL